MNLLAAAQVVAPINWGSLGISLGTFIAAMVGLVAYLDRRTERRQMNTKDEIKNAVDGLAAILTEKLETKENVSQLRIEVARMGEQLRLALTHGNGHET